jgi:hypothetical protein
LCYCNPVSSFMITIFFSQFDFFLVFHTFIQRKKLKNAKKLWCMIYNKSS